MLLKFIIGNFFSCRRCFLRFHLKVKVVENLMSSGIEDHTFGPINLRECFPEEELTLSKNRFLEVASLVEWWWIELSGININKNDLEAVCYDKSARICHWKGGVVLFGLIFRIMTPGHVAGSTDFLLRQTQQFWKGLSHFSYIEPNWQNIIRLATYVVANSRKLWCYAVYQGCPKCGLRAHCV